MKTYKAARQQGFTLIELMIVIAIIAILATLGVTNFSSALRRARDAKRQSDIVAIQKALETCNNIAQGIYIGKSTDNPLGGAGNTSGDGWTTIVRKMNDAGCYNDPSLTPAIPAYGYYGVVTADPPQRFILCAELENWTGNYTTFTSNAQSGNFNTGGNVDGANQFVNDNVDKVGSSTITSCDPTVNNHMCNLFCVFSSQ